MDDGWRSRDAGADRARIGRLTRDRFFCDAQLKGKEVFVRCDLNVPLDKDLNITDDTRIRAAIPTLEYLVKNGAKVLVTSHLVRDEATTRDGRMRARARVGGSGGGDGWWG